MNASLTLEARKDFTSRCTRCSQCKFVPSPASYRYASICPSIDFGHHHAYSAGGQIINAHGLTDGTLTASEGVVDAVASCTMCGGCDVSCKVNFAETVEPLDSLYALRVGLVERGAIPPAWQEMIDRLEATGNVQGHPRARRAAWAEGLHLPQSTDRDRGVFLHVGSTLSYAPERHQALRTIVTALAGTDVSLCYAGDQEGATGATAFDLGFSELAKGLAEKIVALVTASGAGTLVTFSATALAAFRGIYPRWGLHFGSMRVLHITEYLEELLGEGRLTLRTLEQPGKVTYHDSCRLGRLSEEWGSKDTALDTQMGGILVSRDPAALRFGNRGCYEAPRSLLRRMGLHLVEMERHGPSSYCCGNAGGVPLAQPEAAALAARRRMMEARDSGAPAVISGCTGCAAHLTGKIEEGPAVLDLIELLAAAIAPVR